MGRNGKRKYHEYRQPTHYQPSGVGDTLDQIKRAKLDPEASSHHHHNNQSRPSHSHRTAVDDQDGWQTVPLRGSKKKSKFEQNHDEPRLSYNSRLVGDHSTITIKELRDLALYILADGVAPNFVAVKHSRKIRKVVVLMLPGLDEDMMHQADQLLALPRNGSTETRADAKNGTKMVDDSQDSDISELVDQIRSNDFIQQLLKDRLKVRAPGDVKASRVHSPLQAMLMKGIDDGPDKQHSAQFNEKSFQSVRTPISHFVHTADELRDAEYPVHPATFTSDADAELEYTRRKAAGQAMADGWVDSNVTSSAPVIPADQSTSKDLTGQGLVIYAVDCEMVLTSDEKSSLARVSLVSWPDGKVVLDEYVKPNLEITNYFTQYSGITPQILENVTTTLVDIQSKLHSLFTPSTILLGHSLESDLNALKMTHPFIIDTSMIYPHPRGLPLRSSLKFLANKYLKREIQFGGNNGHNSVEDARAVLDLVKLKCEKGPKWGTTEANGETLFKKIAKFHRTDGKGRTTAMVEYGTPERGLGKDATVTIGCQNDEEIVDGVVKVTQGKKDGERDDNVPDGGVDFTWGRLRALEYARGWVNHNTTLPAMTTTTTNDPTSTESSTTNLITASSPPPTIDTTLLTTLSNLYRLTTHLSSPSPQSAPSTLLILYSGTSSMTDVLALQSQQAQYRREFKVKKWDELTVKWTDVEEQALRRAVERARCGWGWVGIV